MRQTNTSSAASSVLPRALSVPHASLGRGGAGKTALLRLTRRRALQRKLPSGLSFDVDDPRKAIAVLKEYRSTKIMLERRGLPATQEADDSVIELYAADRKLAVLTSREAVGQVYANTTLASPADQQERYRQHLEHLAQASVLWVVLSVPAEGSSGGAISRYEDDLPMMCAYLRESLRLRRPQQSCAVAVVITKLDSLFDSEDEARRRWTSDQLTKVVGPLVSLLEDSDKVERAIINPVSAFGFGNAELLEPPDGVPRREADEDEPEWVLRRGSSFEPFNVMPLMAWTFLAGMLGQEVMPQEETILAKACRLLRSDVESLGGWQVPIKGGW